MNEKKIVAIKDFIISAEKSIKNAKLLLKEIMTDMHIKADDIQMETTGLESYHSQGSKIIEGVFTGDDMLGADGNKYPVPANYSSKSKLVQGDKMKLTIEPSGRMIYKQIEKIDPEIKVGLLSKDGAHFQVVSDGKIYNVLTAAVTHFKGNIGDTVTILVPKGKEATYAAIENITGKKE